MKVLSLFSGGGLGDYGLELAGMEIVGQVEIDEYCQKILKLRWPEVPKWRDIKNVRGEEVIEKCGTVDIISGGFPCQPFSYAGNRKQEADNRNLWPEMFRIVEAIRPRWVIAENVPGIRDYLASKIIPQLESIGYENCRVASKGRIVPFVVPACALGANHRRNRVWVVAYAESAERTRIWRDSRNRRAEPRCCDWWENKPSIRRVDDGTTNRVERLKLLGNGQVVQVVEWIGKRIMEFEALNKP